MGYSNPLYTYGANAQRAAERLRRRRELLEGRRRLPVLLAAASRVILAVIAHLLWPRGTDLALGVARAPDAPACDRNAAGDCRRCRASRWPRPGAYAYYNIKVAQPLRDLATTPRNISADYERKYLKYEKLPQPSITKVTLDVQLFPKQRLLIADGRYDLVNKTNAPISDVHVRQGDQDVEFLKLDVAGARLVSDDKNFGYRIYRFDTPLAPGATHDADLHVTALAARLHGGRPGDRRHRERHLREQFRRSRRSSG